MSSRAPRTGRCPAGGRSRPTMTRTEMLRQAKTAAVVQKEPRETAKPATGRCPGPRTGLAKVAPPPADPKKVDFKRPGMTKAMQMRQKAAAEKIKRDAEVQRKLEASKRCPRRTPAPMGGDARMGRERPSSAVRGADSATRLREAISRGHVATKRGGETAMEAALDDAVSRGHIVTDRRGGKSKKSRGGPPSASRGGPLATATPIPGGAKQLARSMDAEIVQAVPLSDGPIDKIIIEPGVISEDRNTIVCIARPGADRTEAAGSSAIANRSIQVISETLDEQDAVESATVQGKLEELQQARREFVIAVANVGGNAVSIPEEGDLSILDIDDMPGALEYIPSPPRPPRKVYKLPDVSHEMFQIDYGLDHPDIQAARSFSRRTQAAIDQREAERRIEEGFLARGAQEIDDPLRFDVPFEQDIMEGDISFEEDEEGHMMPCASRIKASMPPIPVRKDVCPQQPPITVEELQRFMDLQAYPPSPKTPGPPPGRENLNRDLWELEDPWYFEERQPDGSDLIRFDVSY